MTFALTIRRALALAVAGATLLTTVHVAGAFVPAGATTTPAVAASLGTPANTEWEFFRALNNRRTAAGLGALEMSPGLATIAREWSYQMSRSGLSHRPDLAAQVSSRVTASWTVLAENVGVGYGVSSLDDAFYASQYHRANILDRRHGYVGVGVVQEAGGRIWVTFNFMASPPVPTVGDPATQDPGPAITFTEDSEELFRREPDGSLSGKGPNGWYSLGGVTDEAPSASSWGADRMDVVVRGADGAVWHRWYEGGAWHPWESLGGRVLEGPSVVSWASGRLDVFATGIDGKLWHRWFEGSWSQWEPLGGGLTSGPDAASWSPGRLDIVARGGDGAVWHLFWDGRAWSQWSSLGGRVLGGPASAGFSNTLDVVARGTDGRIYGRRWTGTRWTDWYLLEGLAVGDVDAATSDTGTLKVLVAGTDAQLWSRTRDAAGWTGWAPAG